MFIIYHYCIVLPGYDNRCLKPNDSKDPELWDHYDPDDFYDATSQEIYISPP